MLQLETKPEMLAALPPGRDADAVRAIALAALASEEPSAEEDFKSTTEALTANLRLVSGLAELKDDAKSLAYAAIYLFVSASLSDPRDPERLADTLREVLVRTHPEWRANSDPLKRLIGIAFRPNRLREGGREPSALERSFHDAVVGLDAGKEPRHRPTLLESGADERTRIARELERLRSLRFGTVLGHLQFGKRLEKSIEDLEAAAAHFGAAPGAANQKMALTIYRSVTRNMIDMLTLADRKAGLLLNANAISLTVLVAFFGRDLAANPKLWTSSVLIVGTCALTVLFASLAARPLNRETEKVSLDDFLARGLSLLHYGDVARLDRDAYFEGFRRVAHDPDLLERNMLSEMHFFANRIIDKFRMVRRAYLTMISGVLLACAALLLSHFA